MESRRVALLLLSLQLFLVSHTYGKIYIIKTNPSAYGWRDKRQLHPEATVARIPDIAFADSTSLLASPPELVEYLTPPPPGDSLTAAAHVNKQGEVWDLGYDANEILVPPADQARQYDTLKVFSLVPASGEVENLPTLDDSEQDTSGAGSSEDFQEYRRDQRTPESKGPVYTYVKTDKHGHFKWGVRHGN